MGDDRTLLAPVFSTGFPHPREVEVLALVAEGHFNASLAAALFLSERTVMAHMRSVFTKLGLVEDGATHRRVLAVITYL